MKNLPIIGEEVDVSTDLGINSSRKYNIMSTPTVVLFDENDRVLHKLNSLDELKKIFS
jgi:thioredoxin-related protein